MSRFCPVAAVVAIALCAVAVLLRRQKFFPVAVMIAAVAAGFAIATWKTARIAHGVLARPMFSVSLTGFVETRDIRERTDRFVLRVVTMESARGTTKLERVRLSVKKGTAPAVGSFVELKARLLPPLTPVRPGSYDFSRDMFFAGIGASGFVMGAIKTAEPPATGGGLRLRYSAVMQGLRDTIDARIRTTLEGDKRAIATALLTGRRDAISPPVNDAMFISGSRPCAVDLRLSHGRRRRRRVLRGAGAAGAVSHAHRRLRHQEMVGGGSARRRRVLSAAVGGGSGDAALVLHDGRGADRGHGRSPGDHVSHARGRGPDRADGGAGSAGASEFPDVVCGDAWAGGAGADRHAAPVRDSPTLPQPRVRRCGAAARSTMLLLASLVAGLATMPYAAFHFHRVTPYGVLANLAAMPVVSAVVMPAGLLGLVAMPFGFDGLFWAIMGVGIDWMIAVTQWVAALPGAVGRVPAFGIGPLIAASLGIILLGLLRTPLRWSGAVLVLVSGAVGGEGAAAGYSDLRRRPQCRRPRPGWKAASDACGQRLPGCVPAEGVAGGGCRRANGG